MGALRWFDRAHRLAPDDPVVLFLLASATAALDTARALKLLDALLNRHPTYRSAHISRAAVLERVGRLDEACGAIDRILCTMAAPRDDIFRDLANRIAATAACAGWVGLTGDGQVLGDLSQVRLDMDGARVTFSRRPMRRLADGWRQHAVLHASGRGGAVLGSRIDIAAVTRVEGMVDLTSDGTLVGWAFAPNDPDASLTAEISIADCAAPLMTVAISGTVPTMISSDGLMQARGFVAKLPKIALNGPIRVTVHGQKLLGSPLRSLRAIHAAHRRITGEASRRRRGPGKSAGRLPGLPRVPRRARLDVIIPLYRGSAEFQACLDSLNSNRAPDMRIVCVDDGIIDRELRDVASQAADRGDIILLRHPCNLGFPAAINTGITHAGRRDVLLLNSDTMLPPGAVARLADAAYADAATGTVTPLTTDGSLTTCRMPGQSEPMPTYDELLKRDRAAALASPGETIEIPTCVGFCTFIRHDCLGATGKLQDRVFAQGYCEENDFSLRASQLGWRHVAACDVVVAHAGGRSFGVARFPLLARNLRILNLLHPAYAALIAAFQRTDPLRSVRFALARQEWMSGIKPRSIILVTHAHGGGVERHVINRVADIHAAGLRAIVIRPMDGFGVSDGHDSQSPALIFETAQELAAFLKADAPQSVELHHLAYHRPGLEALASLLCIAFDIAVHDYSAICAQVTLCGKAGRYCGEPLDTHVCADCVDVLGSAFDVGGSVRELRGSQRKLFSGARKISVPSNDCAVRLSRYMPGCRMQVVPPEDDSLLPASGNINRGRSMPVRVAIVGALGVSKGYNVLLACARDAADRDLPLNFHVVGHTVDDSSLLATGHVFVTGPFKEGEAQAMLFEAGAHLGFLPSVWPETWCYALSELWRARLPVVAFDIGAQAERMRARGAGVLLPLNLPPHMINTGFLTSVV